MERLHLGLLFQSCIGSRGQKHMESEVDCTHELMWRVKTGYDLFGTRDRSASMSPFQELLIQERPTSVLPN